MTRPGCSPPGAGLGRLRNDGTAAEARKQRRRREARVPAAYGGVAARARVTWVGGPGGGGRLIKARGPGVGVRATRGSRTRGGLGAGGGVRVDPVARKGMTGGPRSSASAAGRSGAAVAVGWPGPEGQAGWRAGGGI
jgi:hypothetical protein